MAAPLREQLTTLHGVFLCKGETDSSVSHSEQNVANVYSDHALCPSKHVSKEVGGSGMASSGVVSTGIKYEFTEDEYTEYDNLYELVHCEFDLPLGNPDHSEHSRAGLPD